MHTSLRRVRAAAASLVVLALLAGCASTAAPNTTPTAAGPIEAILAEHGLDGLDAPAIIDRLDAASLADRPTDLIASVRPDGLQLSDQAGDEQTLPMPDDEFYLSIAPYVQVHHDCHFHSLTTCQGELANTAVHVTVVDDATGETVIDEDTTTHDNGFVGLWLPRGIEATVTVTADAGSATARVSTTAADDATCLTTMQLS